MDIAKYRNAYNQAIGRKGLLDKNKEQFIKDVARLEERTIAVEQAQAIVQEVARMTQSQLKVYVEDIVTKCLDSIFPDTYTFELVYELKNGRTEANLKFTKDGREIDILNASGGGVADVVSTGLRLAAWSLGTSANTIIMDEGLKFLSQDKVPRMAEVLHELSQQLKLQILLVSHSPGLIASADKVFTVSQKNGISKVEVE